MEVHVNAAMSVDGKLATRTRDQVTISDARDFERVDRLRAEVDAVVVGIGTVLADDPRLGLDTGDGQPPARVVIDTRARTPSDATVLQGEATTYIVTGTAAPADRVTALEAAGAEVIPAGEDRVDLEMAFSRLESAGVETVLVEGGGEILYSLFAADLVDTLTLFVGSVVIGGRDAPTLVDGEGFRDPETFPSLSLTAVDRLDDGVLLSYDVP
ncbi:MAG: 2,5-diamino-6-(ribosylamino)-4(3H)-pyrimidinone 5'-phosphate reductase [Halobacteriaceae archaeon]